MGNSKLKQKGWWSRRHETREAQDAARESYQAEHGPEARKRKAVERSEKKPGKASTGGKVKAPVK